MAGDTGPTRPTHRQDRQDRQVASHVGLVGHVELSEQVLGRHLLGAAWGSWVAALSQASCRDELTAT